MRNRDVSIRGALAWDMIHDIMETSLGKFIQTGEFRKDPVEPAWVCPSGYEYEVIGKEPFEMEYLKPGGVVTGRVVLQLRGDGYIDPIKNIYRKFSVRYSRLSYGGNVLTVDYKVALEHPYPVVLEDVIHAYQWLVKERHYRLGQVVITGGSAEGDLTPALCLYLKDHGAPQSAGLMLMSPWADLTCGGDSYEFNFESGPPLDGLWESMLYNPSYISSTDPRDPHMSSVFGDFRDLPPMLPQTDGHEILLGSTLRVAQNAQRAGVKCRVSMYERMFHVFQMSMNLVPKSRETWDEVVRSMQIVYKVDKRPAGQTVREVKRRR